MLPLLRTCCRCDVRPCLACCELVCGRVGMTRDTYQCKICTFQDFIVRMEVCQQYGHNWLTNVSSCMRCGMRRPDYDHLFEQGSMPSNMFEMYDRMVRKRYLREFSVTYPSEPSSSRRRMIPPTPISLIAAPMDQAQTRSCLSVHQELSLSGFRRRLDTHRGLDARRQAKPRNQTYRPDMTYIVGLPVGLRHMPQYQYFLRHHVSHTNIMLRLSTRLRRTYKKLQTTSLPCVSYPLLQNWNTLTGNTMPLQSLCLNGFIALLNKILMILLLLSDSRIGVDATWLSTDGSPTHYISLCY